MVIETDEYIDASEAAHMLGIKRARMSQLCKEGRFSGLVRIGHFWAIPRVSVENYTRLMPGKKPKALKGGGDA